MIDTRAGIETLIRATWGVEVTIGAESTWGHFVIEPQVDLGDMGVVDDVPTLNVPTAVPGIRQEQVVTVPGEGTFRIIMRNPGTSPGETLLVLQRQL